MKIKLLREDSRVPRKSHQSDAGYDLYTPEDITVPANGFLPIKLGIAIQIYVDEVALVQGRSGLAFNQGITTIGNVIDQGYRGEIGCCLANFSDKEVKFKQGDRIAQLLILKLPLRSTTELVEELDKSDRNSKGFGSTGK
tara:strand:+ start:186 stop:605 length:420 start_codon:yes stop_codon:yes gene_type:complete